MSKQVSKERLKVHRPAVDELCLAEALQAKDLRVRRQGRASCLHLGGIELPNDVARLVNRLVDVTLVQAYLCRSAGP